jgi:hypothetical protein
MDRKRSSQAFEVRPAEGNKDPRTVVKEHAGES